MTHHQAIELLRGIGSEMSNVLYNLGQHKQRTITEREGELFYALAKKWDAALSEYRRAPAPTSEPGARDALVEAMQKARFVYRGMRYAIEALDYLQAVLDNPLPDFGPLATPASPAVPEAAPLVAKSQPETQKVPDLAPAERFDWSRGGMVLSPYGAYKHAVKDDDAGISWSILCRLASLSPSPAPEAVALLVDQAKRLVGGEVAAWQSITAPGQVKVGDKLRFTIGDSNYNETVKQVLDAGTEREELIYNKRMNYYVITKNAMTNFGSSKNVQFLRATTGSATSTDCGEAES